MLLIDILIAFVAVVMKIRRGHVELRRKSRDAPILSPGQVDELDSEIIAENGACGLRVVGQGAGKFDSRLDEGC